MGWKKINLWLINTGNGNTSLQPFVQQLHPHHKIEWLLFSWLLNKQIREFSDAHFEIRKPCQRFDWIFFLHQGESAWRRLKHSVETLARLSNLEAGIRELSLPHQAKKFCNSDVILIILRPHPPVGRPGECPRPLVASWRACPCATQRSPAYQPGREPDTCAPTEERIGISTYHRREDRKTDRQTLAYQKCGCHL